MGLLSAQKSRFFHNANMEYDNFQKAIDDGVPMVVIHFDPKTHEEIGREEYNLQNVSISEFQAELLARALLPSIMSFMQTRRMCVNLRSGRQIRKIINSIMGQTIRKIRENILRIIWIVSQK